MSQLLVAKVFHDANSKIKAIFTLGGPKKGWPNEAEVKLIKKLGHVHKHIEGGDYHYDVMNRLLCSSSYLKPNSSEKDIYRATYRLINEAHTILNFIPNKNHINHSINEEFSKKIKEAKAEKKAAKDKRLNKKPYIKEGVNSFKVSKVTLKTPIFQTSQNKPKEDGKMM